MKVVHYDHPRGHSRPVCNQRSVIQLEMTEDTRKVTCKRCQRTHWFKRYRKGALYRNWDETGEGGLVINLDADIHHANWLRPKYLIVKNRELSSLVRLLRKELGLSKSTPKIDPDILRSLLDKASRAKPIVCMRDEPIVKNH